MNSPYKRPRFWFQLRKWDEHQQDTLSGWSVFWLCCLLNSWNKRTLLIFYLLLWGVNNFVGNMAGFEFKKKSTAIEEEMRQDKKDGLSFVTSRMYCTYVNRMKATKHSISAAKDNEHPRYVIHKRTSRCKPCGCKCKFLFLFAFFHFYKF